MKITLKLIISLIVVATAVVAIFSSRQIRQEEAHLRQELQERAVILTESLQGLVQAQLAQKKQEQLLDLVGQYGDRDQLLGLAVYSADGQAIASSQNLPPYFKIIPSLAAQALKKSQGSGAFLLEGKQHWHLQAAPVFLGEQAAAVLVLVHDAGYISERQIFLWRQNFKQLLLLVLLISMTALIFLRWSLLRPLSSTIEWMRRLRTGELTDEEGEGLPEAGLFAPLTKEVGRMAGSLTAAREAAEEEARLRHAGESRWTPERLKEHVRSTLGDRPVLVVANREPYMHVRQGRQVQCIMPASGLVTAVEPILRACGGTWVGSGSGNADREMVDAQDRLQVPPDAPAYTLRRVWLEKKEEDGFYYGFSNEGLWPLCHIAHTRPVFRMEDWEEYKKVNIKFAEATLQELEKTDKPCVLVQDYHFALLPRLIKEKRPDAKVALFWHIPWPNPEAFGICPWAKELLHGMLGADLLGFHIQFHCNNFLDTVDRILESRIDWERFAVNRGGNRTWVKPFPISIPESRVSGDPVLEELPNPQEVKEGVFKDLGISVRWMGVGVDRIDYTKGIAERFRAVERFFEKYPKFQGEFTFVELGAPSRTLIKRYHDLIAELDSESDRINRRFQTRGWQPILFMKKHHSHDEITRFYQAADLCLVTSLHDGMNLVAKEYVASREDNQGTLILSRFAGASREFRDALVINPYDIDQMAEAIYHALMMKPEEQRARMSRMRTILEENNIYRWAADMISELVSLRPVPQSSSSRLSA